MPSVREGCLWIASTLVESVFEYNTPKFVHIKSKKVGLVNRLVQLAILGYVIGYGIVYQKGYQDVEVVQGVVTAKVKGASLTLDPSSFSTGCGLSEYYSLDHVDLVVPSHEPSSFFVTTNAWITCNQTMGLCGEDPDISFCNDTTPCPEGVLLHGGNGITTGNCTDDNVCEIHGWCPLEMENNTETNRGPSMDTKEFTVLVKNSINFPKLSPHFRLRNIPRTASHSFLTDCVFNSSTKEGRTCPIFTLKQIVDMYNSTEGHYEELATKGAVIGLRIHWDCNLDRSAETCKPEYSARRLDNPTSNISPGFNFRYPKYYYVDSAQRRDVWKAYGIWFVVEVTGQGGRFSFTKLVLALGATVGLLAIATIVTDTIALYVLRRGIYYRKKKYQQVEADLNASSLQEEGAANDTDSLKHPLLSESSPPMYGGNKME